MPIKMKGMDRALIIFSIFRPAQADFRKEVAQAFGEEINRTIESGTSPVKGEGRFKDYSDSYKSRIQGKKMQNLGKRLRPVNLKVTGELLDSQRVTIGPNGVNVRYTDEKFIYHNETGAGKSRVLRRMLPTRAGEEFSRALTKWLRDTAQKIVRKYTAK